MKYYRTTATNKIISLRKRIRAVQGGTSASKTISILLYLIHQAQTDLTPTLTSVVSETLPHLKKGAIRDFISIMEVQGWFNDKAWNKTDFVYTFPNKSKLEFFSVDQPDKVRGPRRERLFINEANNIPYEAFDQLEIRTRDFIFLDWNPANDFWFYDKVKNRDDVDHVILTYKDNEALDKNIIDSIEQRKGNARWWKVYGLGELGDAEGKIYRDWQIIDDIPHEARLERYGLDFGYSMDPTALIAIYKYNGGFILDELCYQTGMSNRQIADLMNNQQRVLAIADSAEPKSIDELRSYGLMVMPSKKGVGSVNTGIQFVQDQRISVTKHSLNLIKEYRNYFWTKDKDEKIINVPAKSDDHALDAVRYGLEPEILSHKKSNSIIKPSYAGY